jgi:Ala-tRNA(Pro) deacylase
LSLAGIKRILITKRPLREMTAGRTDPHDACPMNARRIIMSIAPTLQKYLDQKVTYEVITHEPTMSSTRTAQACGISGDRLAKGIVLRHNNGYMLAVLPASHHIRLAELRQQIGADVDLAREDEIDRLFGDCAHGAVPPVGECYGLDVVVDDSIEQQPEIYLEAGDHTTLVHMDRSQFAQLMADALHARFSERV